MRSPPPNPAPLPRPEKRRPYVPPAFETEMLYEANGLACAKCLSGIIDDPYSCGLISGGPPDVT
ncbi:MAG: hypothetical protein V1809_02655 [Planctomycetota bacterium]